MAVDTPRTESPRSERTDPVQLRRSLPISGSRALPLGAAAAGTSFGVILVASLLGWGIATAGASAAGVVGVASGFWFLASGAHLATDVGPVGIAPLLLTALLYVTSAYAVRRTARSGEPWGPAAVRFLAGYFTAALVIYLVGLAGGSRPWFVAPLWALGPPLVALVVDGWGRVHAGEDLGRLGGIAERVPIWVDRALRPARDGALVLLAVGGVLVVGSLVARFGTFTALYAAVGGGGLAVVALSLAQLCVLPNLAIWAVAWIAGPGFMVGEGSSVSLGGSQPGLMPAIPVLAAIPPEGSYPGWLVAVLFIPVAVGFWTGARCSRSLARLTHWTTKLACALAAAVLTAALLALAAWLGSGPLGSSRLSYAGPSAVGLFVALAVELMLGALGHVAVDLVRRRR